MIRRAEITQALLAMTIDEDRPERIGGVLVSRTGYDGWEIGDGSGRIYASKPAARMVERLSIAQSLRDLAERLGREAQAVGYDKLVVELDELCVAARLACIGDAR